MTRRPDDYQGLRRSVADQHGPVAVRILDDLYDRVTVEHAGQFRKSGDPYVTHPVEVARLVTSWGERLPLICAALLHDVSPSRLRTWAEHGVVGDDITTLVDAVGSLDDPRLQNPEGLAVTSRDALVIKLADRLHNARTWLFVPRSRVCEKAEQTLTLYTPKAVELGLTRVADELRSLSVATLSSGVGPPDLDVLPPKIPDLPPRQQITGASGRALGRAVMLLPPAQRTKYLEEWTAELLALPHGRARLRTALGLHYSALRIRSPT